MTDSQLAESDWKKETKAQLGYGEVTPVSKITLIAVGSHVKFTYSFLIHQ
jgi:hypothetical protein